MSDAPPSAPAGGRLIGPHLPLGMGLLKAAERAREIGASAVQVFTDNPTAWRRRVDLPPKLADFRARLADYGVRELAVHGPYLVNLAGADEDFWQRSIDTLVTDMRAAGAFGARYLNVHVGSHRGLGRQAGIARLAEGAARVIDAVDQADLPEASPMLVLENSTGAGDGLGSTLEELADILETLDRRGVAAERVGICLDTAHLWAAGLRIDDPAEAERAADRAGQLLGERLVMVHLNDARTACGSRIDRHEHIGAGEIGAPAIRALLEHPIVARLPVYLETPGMDVGYDAVNMERVRLLLAGRGLPQLPPEAFTVRGSRSRSAPPTALEG
jgi:deoxyribonuclease IV